MGGREGRRACTSRSPAPPLDEDGGGPRDVRLEKKAGANAGEEGAKDFGRGE